MPLDHAAIESMAPDQASLTAARKLLAPKKWPVLARDDAYLWGHCQGSGSSAYRVVLDLDDRGYKCTCPSRKFPCKHVLALAWLLVDGTAPFVEGGERPEWIGEWSGRRRPRAAQGSEAEEDARPKPSLAAAAVSVEPAKDAARAERQRERNRAKREESIARGLDELDTWIRDVLGRGLVALPPTAREECRGIARRLVDAKAPALAARVDVLPDELFARPDAERLGHALRALGELHLIACTYRRGDDVATGLREDARRAVGWSPKREELLADGGLARRPGAWLVAAARATTTPDRLVRLETWLRAVAGPHEGEAAQLLDFVPVGAGASLPFAAGEVIEATLVDYPSAAPLRALVDEGGARVTDGVHPAEPERTLAGELDRVDAERARLPWLGPRLVTASGVRVGRDGGGGLWLADETAALPVEEAQADEVEVLAGVGPAAVDAVWDGHRAYVGYALTELGAWSPPV